MSGLHARLIDLQGSWTGQAATAFQGFGRDRLGRATQAAGWRRASNRINTALTHAGQHYADIEAQNMRMFAR